LLGAGSLYAHFQGYLTPLYHELGLHAFHPVAEQPESAGHAALGGHAGHGGMTMPTGSGGEPSKLPGYAIVTITPERQQLIGVRTGKVERDHLLMFIRAVGIIEPDQTRLARIHTRVSGWVTKVHVNFVGQNVKKGDVLLEIYSPDLLATQSDFLIALDAWQSQGRAESQGRLVEAARRRLELWGVPPDEIRELEKTKKPKDTLKLRAPISGRVLERNVLEGSYVEPATELYRIADLSVVWLQAKIYEYELPHIELNQTVHVSLLSQPGTELQGKVSFVEPVLQEMTRTVKVRVAIANPKDQVKPGMYADLKIEHHMGEGLLVPESAVLRTGERALAFRVLPEGRFEPVEVTLGSRFGERYEVLTGLSEGDVVVTSAGFLIDAESRLKSTLGVPSGHQHGSGAARKPRAAPAGHQHGSDTVSPSGSGSTKKPAADDPHQHHHDH
jgi:Cu(I)/Ag(I) efflux system membrane fusion protein